jgi:hypothetical protein
MDVAGQAIELGHQGCLGRLFEPGPMSDSPPRAKRTRDSPSWPGGPCCPGAPGARYGLAPWPDGPPASHARVMPDRSSRTRRTRLPIALGRGALRRVVTLAWSVARVQPCDQLNLHGRERPTFDLNLLDRVFQRQPFKFGQYELGERPIHNAQLGDQGRAHTVVGKAGLAGIRCNQYTP